MKRVLGLDIGGANLKMAHSDGTARTVPFELWKQPNELTAALQSLIATAAPFDQVAVTMTGELCDCFESKREGVLAILQAVEKACPTHLLSIWRNDGQFVDVATARQTPHEVAAANWLAAAICAGAWAAQGSALWIDVGSTTTDIIPLVNGSPTPRGRTDPERLLALELVYRGVRRTPIVWHLRHRIAAELFATMLDAFILTDRIAENPQDLGTADGRPATKKWAHARMARMLGGDSETIAPSQTLQLAGNAIREVTSELAGAIWAVADRLPTPPETVIIGGSGEFFARELICTPLPCMPPPTLISMSTRLGIELSNAACAYAIAVLAAEHDHGR